MYVKYVALISYLPKLFYGHLQGTGDSDRDDDVWQMSAPFYPAHGSTGYSDAPGQLALADSVVISPIPDLVLHNPILAHIFAHVLQMLNILCTLFCQISQSFFVDYSGLIRIMSADIIEVGGVKNAMHKVQERYPRGGCVLPVVWKGSTTI